MESSESPARLLKPLAVRFSAEEAHWISAWCHEHGVGKAEAVRALLRHGHASMGPDGVSIHEVVHSLQVQVRELAGELSALASLVEYMNDNYGRVVVESLMGVRVLLDAQNRANIERVRELTTRYLERIAR